MVSDAISWQMCQNGVKCEDTQLVSDNCVGEDVEKLEPLYPDGGNVKWCRCFEKQYTFMCSVMSNSLQPHGPQPPRFLCLWDFLGKIIGVGCHFLLQGIFPTQGSNLCPLCLLHCRWILYLLRHCMAIPQKIKHRTTIRSSSPTAAYMSQGIEVGM